MPKSVFRNQNSWCSTFGKSSFGICECRYFNLSGCDSDCGLGPVAWCLRSVLWYRTCNLVAVFQSVAKHPVQHLCENTIEPMVPLSVLRKYHNDILTLSTHVNAGDFALGQGGLFAQPIAKITHIYTHHSC